MTLREAKIRTLQQQLPAGDFRGTLDCAYPVFDCEVEVRVLALERLSAIEEYTLRAIELGADSVSAVDMLLGLGLPATRRSIAQLLGADLLCECDDEDEIVRYRMTENGRSALEKQAIQRVLLLTVPCVVDGVTGEVTARPKVTRFMTPERLSDSGVLVVTSTHDAPTVDLFESDGLRELLRGLSRGDPDVWPDGELVDVQKVVKTQKKFRRLDVVVFAVASGEWITRVFDHHARQKPLEKTFAGLIEREPRFFGVDSSIANDKSGALNFVDQEIRDEAHGNSERLLAVEERLSDVEGALSKARQAPSSDATSTREQLAQLEASLAALQSEHAALQSQFDASSTIVRTGDHRKLLERAFAHAREQIIILSPWLNKVAVDRELTSWIVKAIGRGVCIRVGWGFTDEGGEQPKEDKSLHTVEYIQQEVEAERVRVGSRAGSFEAVRLGNSHAKILVVDSHFCVVTSFNWLSFRADPKRKHREEMGVRMGGAAVVAQWRTATEALLDAARATAS